MRHNYMRHVLYTLWSCFIQSSFCVRNKFSYFYTYLLIIFVTGWGLYQVRCTICTRILPFHSTLAGQLTAGYVATSYAVVWLRTSNGGIWRPRGRNQDNRYWHLATGKWLVAVPAPFFWGGVEVKTIFFWGGGGKKENKFAQSMQRIVVLW